MTPQFDAMIYAASIWVIPLIIAITFHEAAHGDVARFFGAVTLGTGDDVAVLILDPALAIPVGILFACTMPR